MQALRAGLITDTYFFVHHVQHHHGVDAVARAVRKLARQEDLYEQLAESLAPEIYGHTDIKKALLLQLVSTLHQPASA